VRLSLPAQAAVSLPLEFSSMTSDRSGPEDLLHHRFDPFRDHEARPDRGSGLALVARIVGCTTAGSSSADSQSRRQAFELSDAHVFG